MTDFVGFILPPFIDLLNSRVKNEQLRFWVSLAFCVVVAALFNLDKLSWSSVDEFAKIAALVFGESQIIYRTYWKDSGPRAVEMKLLKQ